MLDLRRVDGLMDIKRRIRRRSLRIRHTLPVLADLVDFCQLRNRDGLQAMAVFRQPRAAVPWWYQPVLAIKGLRNWNSSRQARPWRCSGARLASLRALRIKVLRC